MPSKIPYARPPAIGAPGPSTRAYERRPDRQADKDFYSSKAWRRLRAAVLSAEPLCRECRRHGLLIEATCVDHIEPRRRRPDLALDRSNLRALCAACNNRVRRDQAE